jgi:BlaI family penicillinase repressor
MRQLTRKEEEIMLKLWELNQASVAQILELFPVKKPAYNTVSTLVRILEKKKFIKHKKKGRGYIYMPAISFHAYRQFITEHVLKHYYSGNATEMISNVNKQKNLSDLL